MYRTKINYKKIISKLTFCFFLFYNSIFDTPACYENKQIIKSLT